MYVNHGEIAAVVARLQTILGQMETNSVEMTKNRNQLMQEFKGASATGYEDFMNVYDKDMAQYNGSLGKLRVAIQQASDDLHATDVNLAGLY